MRQPILPCALLFASLAGPSAFAEPPSITALGTLDAGAPGSRANGVSADGSVVVGETNMPSSADIHAFRWTAAGGLADLGTIGAVAGTSRANDVSSSGQVVVGTSKSP